MKKLTNELIVFFTAMTPVSELRGAIPLGISLGINPFESLLIALLGNLMIVPILLLFLQKLFKIFKDNFKFGKIVDSWEKRAMNKAKKYRKLKLFGLFLLVAIPIPTTGAYTGVIVANILDIKFKNALFAISAGVVVAGLIVYMISLNIIHLL